MVIVRDVEGVVITYFKGLSCHSLEGTVESHEISHNSHPWP